MMPAPAILVAGVAAVVAAAATATGIEFKANFSKQSKRKTRPAEQTAGRVSCRFKAEEGLFGQELVDDGVVIGLAGMQHHGWEAGLIR